MLAEIDRLGIADNTIVMVMGDNGPMKRELPESGIAEWLFRGTKGSALEGGHRVKKIGGQVMWGWMIFGWVIFGIAFMMALQADTDKQLPKVSQLPLEEQERLLQAERAAAKKKQIQHIGLWGTWSLIFVGLIAATALDV